MKQLTKYILGVQTGMFINLWAGASYAQVGAPGGNQNFSDISENIIDSIAELPGLLTGLSYLLGLLLGVLGILKVKDHVENPTQTPLKDGAIRMASGGGLFALPIVYEAMKNTIGQGTGVSAADLNAVQFNVR